jgi:DNA sulfur modification protein DndD
VKLTFIDDDGEPLEIQRIWHFTDSGIYRPQDEEIHIYEGSTRKAVGPGTLQGNDRTDWFREYIAENLLPFTLAHFFMFDGEQVSVLAEREMSAQVRHGIEGMLGIPVLKRLAKDLRSYAEVRRKCATRRSYDEGPCACALWATRQSFAHFIVLCCLGLKIGLLAQRCC